MLENQLNNSVFTQEFINPRVTPEQGTDALCKYAEYAAQDDRNMGMASPVVALGGFTIHKCYHIIQVFKNNY